jgi:hypothetical protein
VDPRHAREYAPGEMKDLMEQGGFHLDHMETGPYALTGGDPGEDAKTFELLRSQGMPTDLRGDTIHAVAKKVSSPKERYPNWLYI